MQEPEKFQRGFGLVDVIIILFVLGIIAFVVISNIIAQNY